MVRGVRRADTSFGIQSFSFRHFLESKALALGIFWNPNFSLAEPS